MHSAEFQQCLSQVVFASKSHLDQLCRELRIRGLMPVGGRGLHPAQITPKHAANLLLALGAATASKAPEFVFAYTKLRSRSDVVNKLTFGEFLTRELTMGERQKIPFDRLEINLDWPYAVARLKGEEVIEFGSHEEARRKSGFRLIVFSGKALARIAFDVSESDTEIGELISE